MKKYTGKTLSEACQKAKAEMGEDVIIFNTRYRKGQRGQEVEILVSLPQTQETEKASTEDKIVDPVVGVKMPLVNEERKTISSKRADEKFKSIEDKLNYLTESMMFMNSQLGDSVREDNNYRIYQYLLDRHDVSDINAKTIVNQIASRRGTKDDFKKAISDVINIKTGMTFETGKQKRVAFVGPTGVGKTTTIAKIAAYYTFSKKKDVGVICMDSYRIGAEAQLRLYGDIMNVPVANASNIMDLKRKMEDFRDKDLVLIDTAGKSQHSGMALMEISNALRTVEGLDIYLTLALNLRERDIFDVMDKFKVMDYSQVVLTKIDETKTYGTLLNVPMQTEVGISYITCGQNVPEDIIIPDKKYIADLLLKDFNEELEMACS